MKAWNLCRKSGISVAAFDTLKAKLDGINVSDAKMLRAQENKNDLPKRMPTDPMPDYAALKDLAAKKSTAPCVKKARRAGLAEPVRRIAQQIS